MADAWWEEIKARGVADVARAWDLEPGPMAAGRHTWPCPACAAPTRHTKQRDKRGAVGLTPDGQGWRCHQCDEGGDAVTFAAHLALGRGRWSGSDGAELRAECAARGLCEPEPGAAPRAPTPRRPMPPPSAPVAEAPVRPPAAELAALWGASLRLTDVPPWDGGPEWTGAVREYLSGRGLDVGTLAELDMARVLPRPERFVYPSWWPSAWASTWRLVVRAFEPTGELASIHARAIVPGVRPKDRWPLGCGAGGLFLADPRGVAFLRGELAPPPLGVVVTEGLTDTLAMALDPAWSGDGLPVVGVTSGSLRAFASVSWPRETACVVATDADAPGERYAEQIREAVPRWVKVARMRLPELNVKTTERPDAKRVSHG